SFTTPALRIIEDSLSVYSTTGFEPMYLAYGSDETTNLLNISSEDEFKLYPNPATDISQLVFKTEKTAELFRLS
ncbi:MAG: hypothetical protein IPJ79_01415, partial [Bacteroidetes bacterium]|nr:hypothetical protein [Bacteroidota bacterium]